MKTALNGIKVIDLSRMAPGPFCTMVLGDLGADVLRVEQPGGGRMALARVGDVSESEARRKSAFNALNRNKRSIALNLKSPEAQEVLHGLVRDADVFVEGFRPGVVRRLGCDYETISALNPRLVYCSLSGYGQDGPIRPGWLGTTSTTSPLAGALGIIGSEGGPPVIPYNIVADYAGGGFHAATAILAAVHSEGSHRSWPVRGRGDVGRRRLHARHADVRLLHKRRRSPARVMGLNGGAPYYNVYECKDGRYLSVGCIEPWFWQALCSALGREDLFAGQFDLERAEEVKRELRSIFLTRDCGEWWEMLSGIDNIAVAKVSTLDEVAQDPQNLHRRMVIEAGTVDGEDGQAGRHRAEAVRYPGHRAFPRSDGRAAHRRGY